jgi:hypothetical protein
VATQPLTPEQQEFVDEWDSIPLREQLLISDLVGMVYPNERDEPCGIPAGVLRQFAFTCYDNREKIEWIEDEDGVDWTIPAELAAEWLRDAWRLSIQTLVPRPRTSAARNRETRPKAAAAGSSSRARSPGRSDDDPPLPECECGCGLPAPPGRRTVDERHAGRVRLRRFRERNRVAVDPEAQLDELARRRRDWFVREAQTLGPAAENRVRVNELAQRALEIRLRLPSSNGDGPGRRAELVQIEHELERAWESVRTAEAVAR